MPPTPASVSVHDPAPPHAAERVEKSTPLARPDAGPDTRPDTRSDTRQETRQDSGPDASAAAGGSVSRAASSTGPRAVTPTVLLGGRTPLDCETLERIGAGRARVAYDPEARERMERSAATLAAAAKRGDAIYGLTTGFGPHVRYASASDAGAHGSGLIAHLASGCGPNCSPEVVRAILAARCQTLALGRSGIAPRPAEAMLDLLRSGVLPAIPEIGSVGASGDLTPLAHCARVLTGEGVVLAADGGTAPAGPALREAGLEPIDLPGRDALALVNGTAFMTAYAALAIARAQRLFQRCEALTAWAFRSLHARTEAFDARIHEARGHPGQCDSAATVRGLLHDDAVDRSRPLQEVYSMRCAPQVLGACRDQLAAARATVERELNGVSDNPVVCGTPHAPAVLHGGNFQGQHVAFAADAVNAALTQAGLLMERQLAVVLNPELNGGAPLLLAWQPGATSGMAGAQMTATAVAAEMRRSATPSAIATIPTNGLNQDVVSMGAMAARVVLEQVERLATILAVHVIALEQLDYLRAHGRAPGTRVERPAWAPHIEGFSADRALREDIARATLAVLEDDAAAAPGAA